jgi:AP endonuclease-1
MPPRAKKEPVKRARAESPSTKKAPTKKARAEGDGPTAPATNASKSAEAAAAAATAAAPKAAGGKKAAAAPAAGAGARELAVPEAELVAANDLSLVLQRRTPGAAAFDPAKHIKIISWNVAGLRALLGKPSNELQKLVAAEKPDLLCLQETKLSDWEQAKTLGALDGYTHVDTLSSTKKGYSGCRTYVRKELDAAHSFGFVPKKPTEHDEEGRVVTTSVFNISLVNTYVPNAGMTLDRLPYRVKTFDPMMRDYLRALDADKPTGHVVWTGDLNVAEHDWDRYFKDSFKAMGKISGFTPEERASFRQTRTSLGMVDAFRHLYPKAYCPAAYTFFSNRVGGASSGLGWRLDYFVVSAALASKVVECLPLPAYTASDHVPLSLWLSR